MLREIAASQFITDGKLRVVGIDPGKTGALALATHIEVEQMEVMPEFPKSILEILKSWKPDHVFLEKAQAMPKNGAVSMFKYGVSYGEIRGLLIAMAIPFTLVPPRTWAKVMHKGADGKDTTAKEKSKEIAHRIFPHLNFLATERSKKPHDGLIDAALIAEYGRRELK